MIDWYRQQNFLLFIAPDKDFFEPQGAGQGFLFRPQGAGQGFIFRPQGTGQKSRCRPPLPEDIFWNSPYIKKIFRE